MKNLYYVATCNHYIQVTPWLHVVIKVYIVTFVGLNLIGGGKITLGSCFFKISRSLPCLAPKQVKRLSLGIDFNSKSFSNVILKHPLTFSASILNFWCRIMLVIEVLVIDVPCKLSSRSLLHLWTKGPFKYYVSKEVGGGCQILMFADKVSVWGLPNADVSKK